MTDLGILTVVPASKLVDGDRILVEAGPMSEVATLGISEVFHSGHGNVQFAIQDKKIWLSEETQVAILREQ